MQRRPALRATRRPRPGAGPSSSASRASRAARNARHLRLGDRHARRHAQPGRIDVPAVLLDPEADVRTRGEPGLPHVADHLLLLDAIAHAQTVGVARQVRVGRHVAVRVTDLDEVAVATGPAALDHHAVGDRHHRRADRCGVVDPAMGPRGLQDGMAARGAVARGDSRVAQRRHQELALDRRSVRPVVAAAPFARLEVHRGVLAAPSLEARREDPARAHVRVAPARLAVQPLVEDLVAVARADVALEIDVPREDVGEVARERAVLAEVGDRLEERRGDHAGDPRRARLEVAVLTASRAARRRRA